MKIEITKDNSLLIFLNKNELNRLGLNCEKMVYGDDKTKYLLNSLYNDAAYSSGFKPKRTDKRIIEVLPFKDGSCIIIFSFPQKYRYKVKARLKNESNIFEFESEDELRSFLNNTPESEREKIVAIYKSDKHYRIKTYGDSKAATNLISEFSNSVNGRYTAERTEEFWERIYPKTYENSQQPL